VISRPAVAYHAYVNAAGVVPVVVDHAYAVTVAAAMTVESVPSAAGEGQDHQDQDN